jgi:hypothetical protein
MSERTITEHIRTKIMGLENARDLAVDETIEDIVKEETQDSFLKFKAEQLVNRYLKFNGKDEICFKRDGD